MSLPALTFSRRRKAWKLVVMTMVRLDLSAGSTQEYVEDCPVCCRPNVIHVVVEEDGDVRVWGEAE